MIAPLVLGADERGRGGLQGRGRTTALTPRSPIRGGGVEWNQGEKRR